MPFLSFSAFAIILFGIKLWLIGSYGNATPFWDQWDAEAANLYEPFLEGTLTWTELFSIHNEHRIFTTRLLSLALLVVNEIWNPLLQMVINAVLHIIAIGLGIVLLTHVVGRKHFPILLAFSLLLFGIPYAWENTLAGFQSQFYFVLLFSVACLWLTVTQSPLSIRWWGGIVCAVLAFLSLASGILALAAAALVGLILYLTGLRKTCKQLLGVVILAGMFIAGVMLTPSLDYHASLKAVSLYQFFIALMDTQSWPFSPSFFSILARNFPALCFVGVMLWKPPPANDRKWFLLALILWFLGQACSIAYGRAGGHLASRYLDLFAIVILVNFVCLISILQDYMSNRYGWALFGKSIWVITIMVSLGSYAGKYIPNELSTKRDTGIAQEINTKNYLATGDINYLKDKPSLHVPYPVPEQLASILALPGISEILPANISRPLIYRSIESIPADTFVADGYYPSTPGRSGMTLGSYNAEGDFATGHAKIAFSSTNKDAVLAIPVAGYPLTSGIQLEIEQTSQRKPVIIKYNPKEAWGLGYVSINKGPFSIILTDLSRENTGWLAVGAPNVVGRLDALINKLLAGYPVFIIFGLVIIVLSYSITYCK